MTLIWTGEDVAAEIARLNATQQRVLDALIQAGPRGLLNYEICTPALGGLRGGARLGELKRLGLVNEPERIKRGVWRWTVAPALTDTPAREGRLF